MRATICFWILLAVVGCDQPSQSSKDKNTTVFNFYLKSAFNDSIADEPKIWILAPTAGCKGCRQSEMGIVHKEILRLRIKNVEYIFPEKMPVNDSDILPCKYRIDKKELIDRINLPISNLTIIRTSRGKIDLLKEISSDRIDSIGYYLK